MRKLISKALETLALDKHARNSLERVRGMKQPPGRAADKNIVPKVMTEDRQALIRNALKVRRDKVKILDNLSDGERKKLYAAAIRAFRDQDGKNRERP